MVALLIYWDMRLCFSSPNYISIEMLSRVRSAPSFSKCCKKKEKNTVSGQIFWSLKKLRIMLLNKPG